MFLFLFKDLIECGNYLALKEKEKLIRQFIGTQVLPKNVLQLKLLTIEEDRIGAALIPKKYLPSCKTKVLRCRANGNCLYNSASILLVGDESLLDLLRVCVSIELYLEQRYYAEHPYIISKLSSIKKQPNYVFSISLSNGATSDLQNADDSKRLCIKRQALLNLRTDKGRDWGSLMCLAALSNVIESKIKSIYPTSGNDYEILMNGVIKPRVCNRGMLHILWSRTMYWGSVFNHEYSEVSSK